MLYNRGGFENAKVLLNIKDLIVLKLNHLLRHYYIELIFCIDRMMIKNWCCCHSCCQKTGASNGGTNGANQQPSGAAAEPEQRLIFLNLGD